MNYNTIIGQSRLKKYLQGTLEKGMVPHAQLFIGKSGYGTLPMAMAYATDLLSQNANLEERKKTVLKCEKLTHPDLHFVYPVATNEKVKKHPVSKDFFNDWKNFLLKNPYGNLLEWYQEIGIEKKQGNISVDESSEILKTLRLKSFYKGGFKVMIFWNVDKMNIAASNKLLKILEEPPEKTVLILITEKMELLLETIISRCQILHFPAIEQEDIAQHLIKNKNIEPLEAQKIALHSQGDYNVVLRELHKDKTQELRFEKWFVKWLRIAFAIKNKKNSIENLIEWSHEIAGESKEIQKAFANNCLEIFRQALLFNYTAKNLVFFKALTDFKFENFARFIHSENILPIYLVLNATAQQIERNIHPKNTWLHTSIKIARLLHLKETPISISKL